jgi:hypothetical protein
VFIPPRRGNRPIATVSCPVSISPCSCHSRRRFIINLPKIRSVVADAGNPDSDEKFVLLRVQHEGSSGDSLLYPFLQTNLRILELIAWPSALADLSTDARTYLETQNAFLTTYNIELGYDYWSAGSLDTRTCVNVLLRLKSHRGDSARNFSGGTPGRHSHWIFNYGTSG